jgi:protein-S-isoprenylcysteine O-methyltransferase Ste14
VTDDPRPAGPLDDFRAAGGAWVLGQFALIALVALGWLLGPDWPGPEGWRGWTGSVLAAAGLAALLATYRTMGPSFTPMPRPREGGGLVTDGPFRFARHPMYGGGLLLLAGLTLLARPAGLVPLVGLAVLWSAKSRLEERNLEQRFPAYDDYRRATPGRLFPRPRLRR